MPKRSSKSTPVPEKDQAPDEEAAGYAEVRAAAAALGRMGGKKGGPARAKALSSAERKAIAKKAAAARWKKKT